MGEGRSDLISIFTNSEKQEMSCSRNRKVFLDNIIKHYNISEKIESEHFSDLPNIIHWVMELRQVYFYFPTLQDYGRLIFS